MSLITCPDCSHQVSDLAPVCPGCGRPMAGARIPGAEKSIELTSKRFKGVTLVAWALFVLGIVMMIGGGEGQKGPLAPFGPLFFTAGILVYIVNKLRVWWHHR